ncbi:MAG: hypothetical protein E6J72_03915 [Deltaproteobacteria bacterium]|nr:MAG: hypothetical protein E6J72_03915 [Deltaproteobacteria bacterium]
MYADAITDSVRSALDETARSSNSSGRAAVFSGFSRCVRRGILVTPERRSRAVVAWSGVDGIATDIRRHRRLRA